MSETKFTPGPWWVRTRSSGDGVVADCFVAANDVQGCAYDAEILGDDEYGRDGDIERKLADSHLIAAAPELYAKLNWLAEWMRSVEGMSRNNMEQLASEEAEEIDALLAKARGELP